MRNSCVKAKRKKNTLEAEKEKGNKKAKPKMEAVVEEGLYLSKKEVKTPSSSEKDTTSEH